MRIFAGIVGALFLLVGLAAGFSSAVAIGITDGDHSGDSWSCQASGSGSECSFDADSNPNDNATGNAVGIALAIGGGAFLVGGCALIGGAVAGSRKAPVAAGYQQPPVPSSGPPTYGS